MVDRDVFGRRLAKVDHQRLWEILTEELDQLEAYAAALASFLESEE